MDYALLSSEVLYTKLKENLTALGGSINSVTSEMTEGQDLVVPSNFAQLMQEMPFDQFVEVIKSARPFLAKSMDIQEMCANISQENVHIVRELLTRY